MSLVPCVYVKPLDMFLVLCVYVMCVYVMFLILCVCVWCVRVRVRACVGCDSVSCGGCVRHTFRYVSGTTTTGPHRVTWRHPMLQTVRVLLNTQSLHQKNTHHSRVLLKYTSKNDCERHFIYYIQLGYFEINMFSIAHC